MSHSLRRRVLVLVALTAFLVCLPQLASARFSGQQQASLSVGTAGMAMPTGVTGTWTCTRFSILTIGYEASDVDVDSFTDAGPSGATYAYRLSRAGVTRDAVDSTSRSAALRYETGLIAGAQTYRLTITSTLKGWTGEPYVRDLTCPGSSRASGTL